MVEGVGNNLIHSSFPAALVLMCTTFPSSSSFLFRDVLPRPLGNFLPLTTFLAEQIFLFPFFLPPTNLQRKRNSCSERRSCGTSNRSHCRASRNTQKSSRHTRTNDYFQVNCVPSSSSLYIQSKERKKIPGKVVLFPEKGKLVLTLYTRFGIASSMEKMSKNVFQLFVVLMYVT